MQSPAFVGIVYAERSIPTTTGCFFSVHPVAVLGSEAESNPGSLAVDTSATVRVAVIGGRTPVAGDSLICRFIGHRWVADPLLASVSGITIPGCSCNAIPTTLRMTSSNPASNGGMFQDSVIVWELTPPEYASLYLGLNSFLSTTSYTDQYGDSFRYYFNCDRTGSTLSRVYVNSVFGSPYKDSIRYTWPPGYAGNTCRPFLLTNGQIYYGGDRTCVVKISG